MRNAAEKQKEATGHRARATAHEAAARAHEAAARAHDRAAGACEAADDAQRNETPDRQERTERSWAASTQAQAATHEANEEASAPPAGVDFLAWAEAAQELADLAWDAQDNPRPAEAANDHREAAKAHRAAAALFRAGG